MIELVFICWICKKTRGLSFPCLPPLPSFLLICLFKMAKFRVTDGRYIEKFFTNKSYLFPSEFSRGNGSDLGSCWTADNCPWLSHMVLGWRVMVEVWCGHFPLVRASSAVLSSLAVLTPNAKNTVFRTGWPSEYHLLHPALHHHLLLKWSVLLHSSLSSRIGQHAVNKWKHRMLYLCFGKTVCYCCGSYCYPKIYLPTSPTDRPRPFFP